MNVAVLYQLVDDIVTIAIRDEANNIPEYCEKNQGTKLIERLECNRRWKDGRQGDAKQIRAIYSAARWLYRVHDKTEGT
jgi:hypothetical protein